MKLTENRWKSEDDKNYYDTGIEGEALGEEVSSWMEIPVIDGKIEISQEEKAERIKAFLDAVHYLYRDIKGRRENFSPLFIIGGRYSRKNPFFENRVLVEKNKINVNTLKEVLGEDKDIEENTVVGVATDIFDNDQEIKETLKATTVGKVFDHLKEEVEKYYGESN